MRHLLGREVCLGRQGILRRERAFLVAIQPNGLASPASSTHTTHFSCISENASRTSSGITRTPRAVAYETMFETSKDE